ncbi:MAG: hypothetical protein J6C19_11075 [Lachnospiraceae bacterium]|nr:hypothetical protein [Lachnospiraceae bacterium]MBO5146056.1 hypothetical protein [Lachnospiraceae bacterium]
MMRRLFRNILLAAVVFFPIFMTNPLSAMAAPVVYPDGTIFDAVYYEANNPDVVAVVGSSAQALYQHYILYGRIEGRLPYDPKLDADALLQQTMENATLSQTLRATDTTIENLRTALPGTFVTYGVYEQDNVAENGMEPIEWRVLENTGDSVLLMSRYVLDGVPYSNAYDTYAYNPYDVTWETCNLRNWLNTTFYTTAFDTDEQSRILTVKNSNAPNFSLSAKKMMYGNDTFDKVFILSVDEVARYFPRDSVYLNNDGQPIYYASALRMKATPYALKHGASEWTIKDAKACEGYHGGFYSIRYDVVGYAQKIALRTLCGKNTTVYTIGADGTSYGVRIVTYDMGECPVIWVSTK